MIIARLNRFFAKHGTIAYTILIAAMILPLIFLYGSGGCQGRSYDRGQMRVGTIAGEVLRQAEFTRVVTETALGMVLDPAVQPSYHADLREAMQAQRTVQMQVMRGASLAGGDETLMRTLTPEAVNRLCALAEARRLGIDRVTDDELKAKIKKLFEQDGEFNAEAYVNFRDMQLRRWGITSAQFDQIMRDNIVVQRLLQRAGAGVVVPDAEALVTLQNEGVTCSASIGRFPLHQFTAEVTLTDDEVEAYFKERIAEEKAALAAVLAREDHTEAEVAAVREERQYMVPDQNIAEVALFPSADYAEQGVTEEDIAAVYQEELAKPTSRYKKQQVNTRHILLGAKAKDAEAKKKAREEAEALVTALRGGADFAAAVKEKSEDPLTRNKGGDAGWVDKAEFRLPEAYRNAAMALEDNAISEVVDGGNGFYVIQRLGSRDVVPLEEVRSRIESQLQRQRDEIRAREMYDQRKATEFTGKQVRVRQIVKRFSPSDAEDTKRVKRDELNAILETVKAKPAQFTMLARTKSDDRATSQKGGDLGFIGMDDRQHPAPLLAAAMKLKEGEISEVIETGNGYYLLQQAGARDEVPFSEAKVGLMQEIRKERRDATLNAAMRAAVDFMQKADEKLERVLPENRTKTFLELARAAGVKTVRTEPVNPKGYHVPGVSGGNRALVEAIAGTSEAYPLAEAVKGSAHAFVACWVGMEPEHEPAFRETRGDKEVLSAAANLAKNALRRERAMTLAGKAAQAAFERIGKALADGKTLDEAKGDVSFTTEEFALASGPRGADRQAIRDLCRSTASGVLAPPGEGSNGWFLVYVASHAVPPASAFEETRQWQIGFTERMRRQEAVSDYFRRLRGQLGVELEEPWSLTLKPADAAETALTVR